MEKEFQRISKKLNGKPLKVNLYGTKYNTTFSVNQYGVSGRVAIELFMMGEYGREPFGILTCNLPYVPLEDGEVIIKNWSENEDIAKAALASGYFKDTGKRVATGFVEAQIWRVL